MNKQEQIEEMAIDLENHTCMSQYQAEIASKMLYIKGYRKQEDVAREIFEEIEINIFEIITPYKQALQCLPEGYIAELKKKYIGEQE